ncbi:choice-of-anchor Q domain-containing protein [Tahibacter harae]|uniref:Outer membrane repeat protein n=1 Tax=Tahibacter harae TaxID=2963937 RepID=A0ABT1QYR2_9GAMM|nr:choice-of-anchor Q domain-containing protein [Tahibacter harae]MCQ4167429.1 hypothetical protein [Tahibacter harae]
MEHHTTWRRRGARGRCVRALLSLLLLPAAAGAANFTVTTLADNGAGSLRDAVDQANRTVGADVITFGAGLSGSIVLSSGAIDIFDALSINGPGAAQLSISGNHASRLFRIGPAGGSRASLTTAISGLSLIDASSPDEGGAIFVDDSDLTIDGCVFRGNSAQRGGGLYAFPSGSTSLILRNTRFENNTATADGGGFGAQDIDNVSLNNVTVSGNTAARSGGGGFLRGVNINITQSRFSGNTGSTQAPGVGGASGGGALRIDGTKATAVIQISNTQFSANASQRGQGGALWLSAQPPETPPVIASAPLDRIQADANTADLAGGAIYAANLNLTLSNSTLAGNRAQQAGGGIAFQTAGALSLSNATVSGNSSVQASGGGIYSAAATTLELASSTVAGNSAASAGGIRRDGAAAILRNSIIADNTAASAADLGGAFAPNFTLIESSTGTSLAAGSGNLTGVDPLLGALAVNGGPTWTLLPAAASPALNAGDTVTAGLPAADQRGLTRIAAGRIDMGAVERQSPEDVIFRNGMQL